MGMHLAGEVTTRKHLTNRPTKTVILFHFSLGKGLGIGNYLRCLTLAERLKKDSSILFSSPDYFLMEKEMSEEKFSFVREEYILDWLPKLDILVFDHQGPVDASMHFANYRKIAPELNIITLDYFYLNENNANIFINLSGHFETEMDSQNRGRYYTGLKYAIIRPVFHPLRKEPLTGRSLSNVLITFGGEDPQGWSLQSMKWLELYVEKCVTTTIIVGPFNSEKDKIIRFANGSNRHTYRIFDTVNDMERFMKACDLAFCGGGSTLMELAFLGKPVIALPQHEMERKFLRLFESIGYLLPGAEDAVRRLEKEPCSHLFEDPNLREKHSQVGQKAIDGRGAERICQIILETTNSRI